MSVAQTKFAVPRGPTATVVRSRLLDVLDEGVEGALTLVAAPAGAGKSALVVSWIAAGRTAWPVAWLSLDTDDADRRRFWRAVLEALARATGDEAVAALAVSPREPMSMDLVLPALVDALAEREEPVVLVLDDFHEVLEAVQEDLERLVRFPPPALRLVILTRADPPIGLGRLRLDGRLTEIRAADLAFSLDEAAALFDALGIALTPAHLATLWRRTEGWAAALRLAAMSLQHHPDPCAFIEHFAGTDATISDYLLKEVLARQPPQLRTFLLRTSVVDTLSAELADALTGTTEGRASLACLERGGVLTAPLDEHGTWHRYHPLFAELLRAELHAQRPAEVETLHRRAATWLAAHGDDAAAMRHAAAGRAWDLATELITDRWVQLLINGEMAALRPVVEAMPRESIDASPELSLAFAAWFLARGDHPGAAPYFSRAERRASLVPAHRRVEFAATMAAVTLYEGRLRGDLATALHSARTLLHGDALLDGGHLSSTVLAFVLAQLGIVELWSGDLEAGGRHLERAHAIAMQDASDWTAVATVAHLAMARLFRGELARALRHADEAVGLAERRGWGRSEPAGAAYIVQAAVYIQRGQRERAATLVERAGDALRATRERPLSAAHALNRALLLRDRGEPEAALGVLQEARDALEGRPLLAPLIDLLVAQEGLLRAAVVGREDGRALLERAERERAGSIPVANALARLRLLDGEAEAARALVAAQLSTDNGGSSTNGLPPSWRAEAWLLDALALDALAAHEDAARSLERSLDFAEPAGLLRPLTEHGSVVRPLLHRHLRRGTAHAAIVATALDALDHGGGDASPPVAAQLAEPLSERERTILRYLPTMMSNQEIAGELVVSINTVKTHLKAIYRKLHAPGRRDAVRRAREIGLIR
ncbi:MAG: LuxR family transcriptional regulator, maltose regulon positive regulatory protein [Solirubrobacteraceae bacterium]